MNIPGMIVSALGCSCRHAMEHGPNPCEGRVQGSAPGVGGTVVSGGEGGIRTPVTREGPNGFRDRRIQPLCHLSMSGNVAPLRWSATDSSGGESGIRTPETL